MQCPHCGNQVPAAAHFCPGCNYRFKPSSSSGIPQPLIWAGVAVIGVAVLISAVGSAVSAPNLSETKVQQQASPVESKKPEPQGESVFPISAEELYSAYGSNEVSADEKYKGKYVVIEGAMIESISKDFTGEAFVLIRVNNRYDRIHALFTDERYKHQLMDLKAGQVVTIAGRVSGMILRSVILREAQIVKAR